MRRREKEKIIAKLAKNITRDVVIYFSVVKVISVLLLKTDFKKSTRLLNILV